MYKKIINNLTEAIETGILNTLSTDIPDQDIDFNTGGISNKTRIKVKNLDDITQLRNNGINIFKLDTINVLTLILTTGIEISLDELDSLDTVEFINFKACEENGFHDTVINACMPIAGCQWCTINQIKRLKHLFDNKECLNVEDAKNDFEGYSHTYHNVNIIKNESNMSDYPAFDYCINDVTHNSDYDCYLPAGGQLLFLLKYNDLLNSIIEYIGNDSFINLKNYKYWTSSESNIRTAYILEDCTLKIEDKSENYSIIPLYQLKNNAWK